MTYSNPAAAPRQANIREILPPVRMPIKRWARRRVERLIRDRTLRVGLVD